MTQKHKNLSRSPESPVRQGRVADGFTIIEVIISMTIFLTVIAASYQVMRFSLLQRNTISTRIDAMKGARIALNYIRRDAINAGLSYHNVGGFAPENYVNTLLGMPAGTDLDRDLLTGIISGDNVSTNVLNTIPNMKMDSVGFVTRDLTFNSGNFISIAGTSASGSDVNVQTGANQATVCNPYDLYLLETPTSQVVGLVTQVTSSNSFKMGYGAADPLNINLSANGTGNGKSLLVGSGIIGTLKKINLVTYSIRADGTLLRKTYGNNTGEPAADQIQTQELIYNVQNLQVRYLMDDGTITDNPTNNNNGRTNQQKMNQVIQMEVSITVLQNETGLQVSTPITVKEVISARNLRYTVN